MKKKLLGNKVFDYFESRNQLRFFLNFILVVSLFCFSDSLYSQSTLINPATDGGFNLGNTFAANGWTVANEGTGSINWTVGTAASGFTATGSTTSGSAIVTLNAPDANIVQGQMVYGANIPANTFVSDISGTTLTLSQNATATSNITLGFGMNTGSVSVNAVQNTTASIAANTYSVTLSAANPNISVGMEIMPIPGVIDNNTYVASISGTALGLSKATLNNSTLAVAQTLNFNATNASLTGNAAFVTNDNGYSNSYGGYSQSRTIYFYKDVTVPANEMAITLTFDVKSVPSSGSGWQVWVAPTNQNIVGADSQITSPFSYGVDWPGATLISFNSSPQVATTKTTAFIPKSFAGTTFRLIFVWTNSSSAGTLPPAAIDNISLTSRIPEEITCAHSGLWSQPGTWDGNKIPTHADTVVLDNDNEVVMIDSRYSGCEDLILAGSNTLVQFAISTIVDEFTVNNDINIAAPGSRFNNHDGTNGKHLKVGHNFDVGSGARFDSSYGSTTAFTGRLTLNGSLLQTITVSTAGFFGGSDAGTNAFGNRAGVLNELDINNTFNGTSNVVWDVDGVRINRRLLLTSARVNIVNGKRLILGNFGSILATNLVCESGNGFTSGTVSKWISSANTKDVQPGTEYPGTDVNYKPYWYPFINENGLDRSIYLLPDANAATNGEVAITYVDANTTTNSLSITDASYVINKRYDGNWTFSIPDASSTSSPIFYAPNAATPTFRVGVYANGGFEATDGTSRLMHASSALGGTHQDGTAQPFVFRKDIPFTDLTSAPIYVGANDASVLDTTTAITSATSGDWNSASTWVGGVVPTCSNIVVISNGHNVTVTTTADAAGIVINKGGTLTNNAGATTMTVGCTNNNAAFYNYGTHTMSAGILKINGFVAHKAQSNFNHTGGDIIIDSNDNGNAATSVAYGGVSCKIETSNLNLTGGKIIIVDPLVNETTPITASSIGDYTLNTAGASGTFTVNGSATGTTISITGNYNLFEVGQVVSGHANIVPGTTITNVSVAMFGFPPAITLTISDAVTAPIASGTPISYSSMKNGGSTVVLEANADNANLAIGQSVSGNGIQPGSTITGLVFNGNGTNFLTKVTLSNPVSGLTISPIDAQQALTFGAVSEGANSTVLSATNTSIKAGMIVKGQGIKPGTFVTSDVTGTGLNLSEPIQAGAPTPLVMEFYPFNTQSSGSFIYASSNHYAAGLNHTLQIGDGVSTDNTSVVSNGFNCQFQGTGKGLFSLGNLIVDAPNGDTRFMNISNNNINNGGNASFIINVQNNLTITAGSSFRKTFGNGIVYVGGNIVNNGSFNMPKAGTPLYLGNYINGAAVPTSIAQTISGTGSFLTNQWSLTSGLDDASLNSLTINNTNPAGVILNVPNFRVASGVSMTNGILYTSSAYPLYVGNPNVTSSTNPSGSLSGGSATSYINGPVTHANMSSATIGQFKLFPVGKNGKYLPILISSTGGVELMVEAFDTNSGSVNTINASSLSQNRWTVSRVGSAGDFTGYNVRLAPSDPVVNSTSIIVHSNVDQGVYDIVSTPSSAITYDASHFSIPTFPSIVLTTNQTGGFLGNFAYAQGPACIGTPTPGATIASSSSVCSGQSVVLSLENATTGAEVTYQWQSSTDGGTNWSDILGAETATYNAFPSQDTSYQCIVTCSSASGISTPVVITTSASIAVGTNDSICVAGTANLEATGSAILNWYDAPTNGNLVATGTTFNPVVSNTTNYYVASATETSGSINTNSYTGTSTSANLFRGIAFDVTNKLRLNSVTVYPKNTTALTPITIALYDANGNIVSGTNPVTFIPTLVTGTVGSVSQVVNLNYNIPVGNGYRLVATNGLATTTNTLGTSTASIVYPTGSSLRLLGNVTSLTSTIVTTSNTTYYFHNLSYDEICESTPRTIVTATVVNTPPPTGDAIQDSCSGTIGDFIVNGESGAIFTWYDAEIDGNQIPTTTAAVLNTTYYVSQTINGCEGPRFVVLAQGSCLGATDFEVSELKFYPNPVTDQLTISTNEMITKVEIFNMLGQQVTVLEANKSIIQLNLTSLSSSTYLVKVYTNSKVQNFKVIKK